MIEFINEEIENENIMIQGLTFLKKNLPIYMPETKILTRIDQFLQNFSKNENTIQTSHFIRCLINSQLSNVNINSSRKKETLQSEDSSNNIKKIKGIEDYVEHFSDLVSSVPKWTQPMLEMTFVFKFGQVQLSRQSFSELNDNSIFSINLYSSQMADKISVVKEHKKQ